MYAGYYSYYAYLFRDYKIVSIAELDGIKFYYPKNYVKNNSFESFDLEYKNFLNNNLEILISYIGVDVFNDSNFILLNQDDCDKNNEVPDTLKNNIENVTTSTNLFDKSLGFNICTTEIVTKDSSGQVITYLQSSVMSVPNINSKFVYIGYNYNRHLSIEDREILKNSYELFINEYNEKYKQKI